MQARHHQSESKLRQWWPTLAVGTLGAIVAAPYLPTLLGSPASVTEQILNLCKSSVEGGTGLAKLASEGLGSIPFIGESLAAGGWASAIASGALGIGGTLLGDYIHNHYDRKGEIQWGRIVKYAAITSSVLVALPSLLSGISMGMIFLAYGAGGAGVASSVASAVSSTLGLMGDNSLIAAGAGLSGLLSHFATCGAALLPAGALALHQSTLHAHQPYRVQMLPSPPPVAGQPCRLTFQIIDNETNRPLASDELENLHESRMHTMLVDSSLNDYHHVHPRYDAALQAFTCEFTPRLNAHYSMWNDFRAKGDAQGFQLKSMVEASRPGSAPQRMAIATQAQAGGVQAHFMPAAPLRAGEGGVVNVSLQDEKGNRITDLEPIMGAYAHLVGFSADGQHFIHCHPMGAEPKDRTSRGVGQLQFHIQPEHAGFTKFFLQVRRDGNDIALPFGTYIAPPAQFAARPTIAAPTMASAAVGRM